jgi:hypothetical protein
VLPHSISNYVSAMFSVFLRFRQAKLAVNLASLV